MLSKTLSDNMYPIVASTESCHKFRSGSCRGGPRLVTRLCRSLYQAICRVERQRVRERVTSGGPQAIDPELVNLFGKQLRQFELDTHTIFRKQDASGFDGGAITGGRAVRRLPGKFKMAD